MGNKMRQSSTFRMIVVPSFLTGIASAIDFTASLPRINISDSDLQADISALKSDWKAVGSDFQFALDEWNNQNV